MAMRWQETVVASAGRGAHLVPSGPGLPAANRLPNEDELKGADATSALMMLERLKSNPTQAAQALARSALIAHSWALVREETKKWLAHLAREQLDKAEPTK